MSSLRLTLVAAFLLAGAANAADTLTLDVHRDANCSCCKEWIKHLEANGFKINDHVEGSMSAVKQSLGVPHGLASCHTAVIDGKFIEGHVPAAQIKDLRSRQDLAGIAVPGMPMGSPGMENGQTSQPYQVIGLSKTGAQVVVASYPGDK
ncbi:DUF411 domain-containing protein [Pseudomonas syringae pv. syringae]|uniref:DUF411 domain-containing protein n=1 Tax=Pseudomonas syringae TaxID=317 RepID=UPI001F10B8E5|nr:DUF411 domain-containing protein [Pseudomonas syringae]MCH5633805.1 DUF411 domain-containing protein [Pseudomonas syringae pv. syringae]MCH5663031.1 DUF411 domain-containing protein [Pseudomonas syringae pv. syringae]